MNTRVLKLTVWKWVDAFFFKTVGKGLAAANSAKGGRRGGEERAGEAVERHDPTPFRRSEWDGAGKRNYPACKRTLNSTIGFLIWHKTA